MTSFLKGLKLWRYKTGDYVEPTKGDRETKEKFVKNLNEWDRKIIKLSIGFTIL